MKLSSASNSIILSLLQRKFYMLCRLSSSCSATNFLEVAHEAGKHLNSMTLGANTPKAVGCGLLLSSVVSKILTRIGILQQKNPVYKFRGEKTSETLHK